VFVVTSDSLEEMCLFAVVIAVVVVVCVDVVAVVDVDVVVVMVVVVVVVVSPPLFSITKDSTGWE